jgi:DNA repair exonuclease SbcCD ATPase subunit
MPKTKTENKLEKKNKAKKSNNIDKINIESNTSESSDYSDNENNDNVIETVKRDYNINIINYRTEIKHIIHISDIHINLQKRHDEYRKIFQKLYHHIDTIKKEHNIKSNKSSSVIIVLTGDILHSKSDLSPECISITYEFIKTLCSLLPLVIIPGNHDTNMNNKQNLDSLTPIICDLPENYPIHYFNKTGLWLMNNLLFSHASIKDYHIISPDYIDDKLKLLLDNGDIKETQFKKIQKIALYHGRINGAELFENGITIDGEINQITKQSILPSSFKGYDFGLFGDIHKFQAIDINSKGLQTKEDTENKIVKTCAAYAGSLIQQNFGESIYNHGYLLWDLKKKEAKLTEIENDFAFVKLYINDNKADYFNYEYGKTKKEDFKTLTSNWNLPRTLKVRILYRKTNRNAINEYRDLLKIHHNILDWSSQENINNIMNKNSNYDNENNNSNNINITNLNTQLKLVEFIAKSYENIDDKLLENIKKLHSKFHETLNINDKLKVNNITNTNFKLIKLEFDNLFSYKEKNVIDFSNLNGVVGIIGENHIGKSSIIDIILFALYNKTTRKGAVKDYINVNKNKFKLKLEVEIGNDRFTILKSGQKDYKRIFNTKCSLIRKNLISGHIEHLDKSTTTETAKYISELFGSFEDAINTNFSIQTNSTGFIDSTNVARKAELERILHYDFINTFIKEANNTYKNKKAVYNEYISRLSTNPTEKALEEIEIYNDKLKELNDKLSIFTLEQNNLQTQIDDLNKQYNPKINDELNEVLEELELTETEINNSNNNSIDDKVNDKVKEFEDNKTSISKKIKKKISNLNDEISNIIDSNNNLLDFTLLIKSEIDKLSNNNLNDNLNDNLNNNLNDNQTNDKSSNTLNDSYKNNILEFCHKISLLFEENPKELLLDNNINNDNNNINKYINFAMLDLSEDKKKLSKENKNIIKEFNSQLKKDFKEFKKAFKEFIKFKESKSHNLNKKLSLYKYFNSSNKAIDKQILNNLTIEYIQNKLNDEQQLLDKLTNKMNEQNDIESKINNYESKIEKYNEEINELRNTNEQLISDELPKSLLNIANNFTPEKQSELLSNISDNINNQYEDLIDSNMNSICLYDENNINSNILDKYENDENFKLTNNNPYIKCMEFGWIYNLKKYINNNENAKEQLNINNEIIKDLNEKIVKYKNKVSKSKKLLDKSIHNEFEKQQQVIKNIQDDINSFNENKSNNENILSIQLEIDTLHDFMNNDIINNYLDNSNDILSSIKSLETNKKENSVKILAANSIKDKLKKLIQESEINNNIQKQLLTTLEKRKAVDINIRNINNEIGKTKDNISVNRGKLEGFKEDEKKLKETTQIMTIYEFYIKILKELPLVLINRVKNVIQTKINDLLSSLTDFTIEFEITEKNIDIYLVRSSYLINEKQGRILINNSSGFERFISSIAIRIALVEISQLPSPNFIAIDEGWSCFDNNNINNINLILENLNSRFDFILTISHLQNIRQHCDTQISVVRDNDNFSSVKFSKKIMN